MSIPPQEEVPKAFDIGDALQAARAKPILRGARPRITQKRRQCGADFALPRRGLDIEI
jgi:hypothetical protein